MVKIANNRFLPGLDLLIFTTLFSLGYELVRGNTVIFPRLPGDPLLKLKYYQPLSLFQLITPLLAMR